MSVVHFVLKRTSHSTLPVKSKESLVFHCGVRRFSAAPIFSQHTVGDKQKVGGCGGCVEKGGGKREERGGYVCVYIPRALGQDKREVKDMFIHPCAPHDVLFIVDIVLNAVSVCI